MRLLTLRGPRVLGALLLLVGLGLLWVDPLAKLATRAAQAIWFPSSFPHPLPRGAYQLLNRPAADLPQPPAGAPVGRLLIPALHLDAAVVQGTGDAQLLLAPGHLPGSVLPGADGTSVIAAHNATYFRHLNRLSLGQRIYVATAAGRFAFAVTGKRVVRVGTPLANTRRPSLVLEACYPLSALYLTDRRYWVETRFLGRVADLPKVSRLLRAPNLQVDLAGTGLSPGAFTVTGLGIPMGTLSGTGGAPSGISQSGLAWQWVSRFLLLYGVTLHRLQAGSPLPATLATPGAVPPTAATLLQGTGHPVYGSRLDLRLLRQGSRVTGIEGMIPRLAVSGPGGNRLLGLRLTAQSAGGRLVLRRLQVLPPGPPGVG